MNCKNWYYINDSCIWIYGCCQTFFGKCFKYGNDKLAPFYHLSVNPTYNNQKTLCHVKQSDTLALWKRALVSRGFFCPFPQFLIWMNCFVQTFIYTCCSLVLLCFRFSAFCWGLVCLSPRMISVWRWWVFRGGEGNENFSVLGFLLKFIFLFVLGLFISACCVICCGNHWNATPWQWEIKHLSLVKLPAFLYF